MERFAPIQQALLVNEYVSQFYYISHWSGDARSRSKLFEGVDSIVEAYK